MTWVIEAPCGCRLERSDNRYRWTVVRKSERCGQLSLLARGEGNFMHRQGQKFPRDATKTRMRVSGGK
jgi:hypothetical protein